MYVCGAKNTNLLNPEKPINSTTSQFKSKINNMELNIVFSKLNPYQDWDIKQQ